MTEPTDVDVVIVAFHRPCALSRLLARLDGAAATVCVVNVEADPAVARTSAGHEVIDLVENRGYGAGVNLGASRATGDYLVFCNDDVEIDARSLERLLEPLRDGRAGVSVPGHVGPRGERVPSLLPSPTPRSFLREWLLLPPVGMSSRVDSRLVRRRLPETEEGVDAANGALVACRREVLADVPFREEYFLYWEELEWFARVRDRGHRVVYVPSAVLHRPGGAAEVAALKATLMAENAVRCVRDVGGRRAAVAMWPAVVLWNLRLLGTAAGAAVLRPSSVSRSWVRARGAGLRAALGAWRIAVGGPSTW